MRKYKVLKEGVGNHASGYEEDFIVMHGNEHDGHLLSSRDLVPPKLRVDGITGCADYGLQCPFTAAFTEVRVKTLRRE